MFSRLKGLLGVLDSAEAGQTQREALIDLLIWTMYADRRIALPESEHIDLLPAGWLWDSVTPFGQYVQTALARIREVLSDEPAAEALLEDVYTRLGTTTMRKQAYEACCSLAGVDGQVAEEETRFLERIRTRFGL